MAGAATEIAQGLSVSVLYMRGLSSRISNRIGEPWRSVVLLTLLFLARSGLQAFLYRQGFLAVSADEFSRGILAAQWALDPRINIVTDFQGVWLPLEKYLNGSVLRLWPDVIWAPRVTVYVFSCALLITVYLLVYILFDDFVVAALATLLSASHPWFAWLSGTPMLEMYYLTCWWVGLLFLVLWLRQKCQSCWIWAGLSFGLASSFHVQSWVFVNIASFLTILSLYQSVRQKVWGQILRLIAYYLLSNAFVVFYTIVQLITSGQSFAFLTLHTFYSKWFYQGYAISSIEKFLYYPSLLFRSLSWVIWVFVLLALVLIIRDQDRRWKLIPLIIAVLVLVFNSIINIVSVPATAAPDRYAIPYVLLLFPYAAFGIRQLHKFGARFSVPKGGKLLQLSVIVLTVFVLWRNTSLALRFPPGPWRDAIAAGRSVNAALNLDLRDFAPRYMVELRYWDYLGVRLTAQHYDAFVYDREFDLYNRNTRSIFEEEPGAIKALLASQSVRYVALITPSLKTKARSLESLRLHDYSGGWEIYEVATR